MHKSTSLKNEPSSELLLITAKQLFSNRELLLVHAAPFGGVFHSIRRTNRICKAQKKQESLSLEKITLRDISHVLVEDSPSGHRTRVGGSDGARRPTP